MKLIKIVEELDTFDQEKTIYATESWTKNSLALIATKPESGQFPKKAEDLGLIYFIEVFLALEFLSGWP